VAGQVIGRLAEHDRYDELCIHQPGALARWLESQASPFPEELRSRAQAHQEQVMKGFLEPVTPLLANVTVPATLIIGGHDPVTGPAQVAAFERLVPNGRVVRFPDAAHFVQLEEPEAYADLVTHAVTQARRWWRRWLGGPPRSLATGRRRGGSASG